MKWVSLDRTLRRFKLLQIAMSLLEQSMDSQYEVGLTRLSLFPSSTIVFSSFCELRFVQVI